MPNDIHELTIVASVADQFVENVLHFQNNVAASTQPGTDSASLIAAFQADVEPTWLACLADDYGLQGYRCKRVNNSGGPSVIVPRSGVPGSFGTNSVTSGQGACIISSYKYIPSIGSDKYRTGRIFMPAIAESAIEENELQPGFITALQALCDLLAAELADGLESTYGVYSRQTLSTVPFYVPDVIYPSSHIATQRRRLRPVL
jgi:hypothetical protein